MSAKLTNNANIFIQDTIDEKTINKKRAKIIQNLAKNVKIDGFRKGKVPTSIIEKRFSDKINQDSEQESLNELIAEQLKELNIKTNRVIGNPIIAKYEKNNNNIDVEVKIGLFPQIDIKDYTSFIPQVTLENISQQQIDERLNEMAKNSGELVESNKTTLEQGDIANIDFEGFLDEVPFEGGKGEKYDLEIGSKSFIEGFEDNLIGMKKDENKDINLVFPQNYNATHLAGKKVVFKVKLNEIKERKPSELNDDFAKKMLPNNQNATLDELKIFIKTQLEHESKSKIFNELKPKLADNLIANIAFDLPENIIEQEMDIIFRNSLRTLSSDELKELQQNKDKAKEKRESFREEAQKSVQLTFIIDSLAKMKNISVSDNEIYQMIYYEAMMSRQNPKEVMELYEKNNMIPAIKMTILEDKVLNNLLESTLNNTDSSNTESTTKD